jgi:Fur family iron response transcriptional regulator
MEHKSTARARTRIRLGICSRLESAGLRPTRQRVALAKILFCRGDRHVTAEGVHQEAVNDRIRVSLATVYNTLNQFTEQGLLRRVMVVGAKTYYDSNISEHPHFFVEDDQSILDIPPGELTVENIPPPPAGYEVDRIDVIVRLRRLPS